MKLSSSWNSLYLSPVRPSMSIFPSVFWTCFYTLNIAHTPNPIIQSEGSHELAISVAGMPIAGSPFSVPVLDPSAVRVIGLRNDRVGVEQQFNGTSSQHEKKSFVRHSALSFQSTTTRAARCRLRWRSSAAPVRCRARWSASSPACSCARSRRLSADSISSIFILTAWFFRVRDIAHSVSMLPVNLGR